MPFGKRLGQIAVFGQRRRKPGKGHGERVEAAGRAYHAAGRDGGRQNGAGRRVVNGGARHIRPASRGPAIGIQAGERHRRDRDDIGQGHQQHGDGHRQRVCAAGPVHFAGDGRRVVPAHVVPHGHQNSPQHIDAAKGNRRGGGWGALEQRVQRENRERTEQNHAEGQRAEAHAPGPQQVPCGANGHQADADPDAPAVGRQRGREMAQVRDEEGGIDGHVEQAAGQGQPSLLKTPETAHGAGDPYVVAAIAGKGTGQLGHHQRGG